jgi:thiamine-phosphate pyrophosphorylase
VQLIVISPEAEDPREAAVLPQLLAAGLAGYHLRKPGWGRDAVASLLRRLPADCHPRIVLHSHHELAAGFAVGGLHERDEPPGPPRSATPESSQLSVDSPGRLRSRAVHDLASLGTALSRYDRVLFSPVFPSLSKPGRVPGVPASELRRALLLPRRAEVFALGGVDATRIAACRELGFDGVAVLGAVWQATDPVQAHLGLQRSLLVHAD